MDMFRDRVFGFDVKQVLDGSGRWLRKQRQDARRTSGTSLD